MSQGLFLSYSGIKAYGFDEHDYTEGCPYRWFLQYVKQVKPTRADCRNFFVGAVCHSCLERWIKEGKCQRGWMLSISEFERDKYLAKNLVIYRSVDDRVVLKVRILEYLLLIEKAFYSLGLHTQLANIRSEVAIKVWVPAWKTTLYARLDFMHVITRHFYDLKVTKTRKYFDLRQGIFISMLNFIKTRSLLPVFHHFIPLMKKVDEEIIIEENMVVDLLKKVKRVIQRIGAEDFEARPSSSTCFFCPAGEFCKFKQNKVQPVDIVERDGRKIVLL